MILVNEPFGTVDFIIFLSPFENYGRSHPPITQRSIGSLRSLPKAVVL